MSSRAKHSYRIKLRSPKYRTEQIERSRTFEVQVIGFPPTGIEIYSFTKILSLSNGIATSECYTYTYRRSFDVDRCVLYLENHGFVGYSYQRNGLDNLNRSVGADGRDRYWLIRTLPNNAASSASTRQEGLSALVQFFSIQVVAIRSPREIATIDNTGFPPLPMNRFLFDEDIIELMHVYLEHNQISPMFAVNYPAIAGMFFRDQYPLDAEMQFGYRQNERNSDLGDGPRNHP